MLQQFFLCEAALRLGQTIPDNTSDFVRSYIENTFLSCRMKSLHYNLLSLTMARVER